MIAGHAIVYYGPEVWQGMWRNRHHLLVRLARANRVVYVEPRPYIENALHPAPHTPFSTRGDITPLAPNLWVYRAPLYAPLGGPPPLRAATHPLRRSHLNRALARMGVECPIVWLSTPAQFDARTDIPAALRVYHIVDEYLGYHDMTEAQRQAWAEKDRALVGWSDLAIVVSQALLESKGRGRDGALDPKFRLLPNAVDDQAYGGPPPPIPPILAAARAGGSVLGYIGLISIRLDLALLDALMSAHPEWTLVLMGSVNPNGCAEMIARLAARPNVRILPPVDGGAVAPYVRSFDVGLVPYRVTPETRHASPLKVYEYLAAGLPVVAADVPGATQFGPAVAIAHTVDQWGAAVQAALDDRSPAAQQVRRAAVAPHTWSARVETLSDMLLDALAQQVRDRDLRVPAAPRGKAHLP